MIYRNRVRRLKGGSMTRRNALIKNNRIRASAEHLSSASDPKKQNGRSQYHPSEEIAEPTLENCGDATLTAAEATRTIIEVLHCIHLLISGNNFENGC